MSGLLSLPALYALVQCANKEKKQKKWLKEIVPDLCEMDCPIEISNCIYNKMNTILDMCFSTSILIKFIKLMWTTCYQLFLVKNSCY